MEKKEIFGIDLSVEKLGERIDVLYEIKLKKEELNNQIKLLNEQYGFIEQKILDEMSDLNTDRAGGFTASVTAKIETYPQVTNIEEFTKWVVENEAWEFVQKRVNKSPVVSMYEAENLLPNGIDIHTEPKLSLRKKAKIDINI